MAPKIKLKWRHCYFYMSFRQRQRQVGKPKDSGSGVKKKRSRSRSRSAPKSEVREPVRGQHNIVIQWKDKYIKRKSRCDNCEMDTSSIRRLDPGEITWICCALTTITSFCLLPFFIESCNDKMYFCAECLELKEETKADFCSCKCRWLG